MSRQLSCFHLRHFCLSLTRSGVWLVFSLAASRMWKQTHQWTASSVQARNWNFKSVLLSVLMLQLSALFTPDLVLSSEDPVWTILRDVFITYVGTCMQARQMRRLAFYHLNYSHSCLFNFTLKWDLLQPANLSSMKERWKLFLLL